MWQAATPVVAVTKVPSLGSRAVISRSSMDLPLPAEPVKKMFSPWRTASSTRCCPRESRKPGAVEKEDSLKVVRRLTSSLPGLPPRRARMPGVRLGREPGVRSDALRLPPRRSLRPRAEEEEAFAALHARGLKRFKRVGVLAEAGVDGGFGEGDFGRSLSFVGVVLVLVLVLLLLLAPFDFWTRLSWQVLVLSPAPDPPPR